MERTIHELADDILAVARQDSHAAIWVPALRLAASRLAKEVFEVPDYKLMDLMDDCEKHIFQALQVQGLGKEWHEMRKEERREVVRPHL